LRLGWRNYDSRAPAEVPYDPGGPSCLIKTARSVYFVLKTKSSFLIDDLHGKGAHFVALGDCEKPARYLVATSLCDVLKTIG
jgi:hypothetical protein